MFYFSDTIYRLAKKSVQDACKFHPLPLYLHFSMWSPLVEGQAHYMGGRGYVLVTSDHVVEGGNSTAEGTVCSQSRGSKGNVKNHIGVVP